MYCIVITYRNNPPELYQRKLRRIVRSNPYMFDFQMHQYSWSKVDYHNLQ